MQGRNRINNDARIGNNSNGNNIFQNSQIMNPTIITGSGTDILDIAAQCGRYDLVQQQFAAYLDAARRTHPLYPEFSADYNSKLGRLISTPETADALRKHPKRIKGTYRLDYSKYPYMDKSETPWEYAYRTQTTVEMDTTSYKEFLGELEDPFPVCTYSEGMRTIIGAPEFPDAVDAFVVSGNVSIPFMLRRVPCMEFGWIAFANVSHSHGFDVHIKTSEEANKTNVTFNKTHSASLEAQLLRENLFVNMASTRKLRIVASGKELLSYELSEQDLKLNIFAVAKPFAQHIENLLAIENHAGCKFNPDMDKISVDDYNTAQMLASSIKGEWFLIRGKYDNAVHADYDRISQEILEKPEEGKFSSESTLIRISLGDQQFTGDKARAIYHNARISNLGEVRRAVRKKRKNIRIIIKPQDGMNHFLKYVRFDGVKMLTDQVPNE